MFGLILRVFGVICWILAGANQTLLQQPPADLIAWGLALWGAGSLLGGYGPQWNHG